MPALQVNPNRMELLRLKRRMQVAQRGHKLLKDKFDELMKEFLARIAANRALRAEVEDTLRGAYALFAVARAEAGSEGLEIALSGGEPHDLLDTVTKGVMNVRVPIFRVLDVEQWCEYSLATTPAVLDNAFIALREAMPRMIELAEREKAIELLAAEIERTRRRVNALEHVLIPQLVETVRLIQMRLDEAERANLTRLMKVKELVSAKARPAQEDTDQAPDPESPPPRP